MPSCSSPFNFLAEFNLGRTTRSYGASFGNAPLMRAARLPKWRIPGNQSLVGEDFGYRGAYHAEYASLLSGGPGRLLRSQVALLSADDGLPESSLKWVDAFVSKSGSPANLLQIVEHFLDLHFLFLPFDGLTGGRGRRAT